MREYVHTDFRYDIKLLIQRADECNHWNLHNKIAFRNIPYPM